MLSKDILLQEESYLEKEEELYVFFLFFLHFLLSYFSATSKENVMMKTGNSEKKEKSFLYSLFPN